MICVGIDPGIHGAVAFVGPATAGVLDIPTIGGEIDTLALVAMLTARNPDVVVIEQLSINPKFGTAMLARQAKNWGKVRAAAEMTKAPVVEVQPQRWKKEFQLLAPRGAKEKHSARKDRSRWKAIQMFPVLRDALSRKLDENRAEALLIAQWGRKHAAVRKGSDNGIEDYMRP